MVAYLTVKVTKEKAPMSTRSVLLMRDMEHLSVRRTSIYTRTWGRKLYDNIL